jgi:hypothetical protein
LTDRNIFGGEFWLTAKLCSGHRRLTAKLIGSDFSSFHFFMTFHHIFSGEFWLTAILYSGQWWLAAILTAANQTLNFNILANSKPNSKIFYNMNQGDRWFEFMKKTRGKKSRATVPLSIMIFLNSSMPHKSQHILCVYGIKRFYVLKNRVLSQFNVIKCGKPPVHVVARGLICLSKFPHPTTPLSVRFRRQSRHDGKASVLLVAWESYTPPSRPAQKHIYIAVRFRIKSWIPATIL